MRLLLTFDKHRESFSALTHGTLQVFLGVFPELHFSDAAANAAAKKFKGNLELLNANLSARNASPGVVSYPYMLPSLVPNSIAK